MDLGRGWRKDPRSAMTLVEMIMAVGVLVLLLGGVYKVFRNSTNVLKAGMWTSKAQNEVRNALNLLRDEIARASPFSTVTPDGVQEDPDPKYRFLYRDGVSAPDYEGPLLRFYQCRTAIQLGAGGDAGGAVLCEVSQKDRRLIINKTLVSGTSNEKLYSSHVLLTDMTWFEVDRVDASVQDQMARHLIRIQITVFDSNSVQRTVTEETKAKVDAEVGTL